MIDSSWKKRHFFALKGSCSPGQIQVVLAQVVCFATCVFALAACHTPKTWDIRDYGAVGDGTTLCTQAIQHAVDACSRAGRGTVVVDGGTFVSGTILLKSGVTLQVSHGAVLQASVNPNHFKSIDPFIDATGQYRGQCFIGAIDVENVGIQGRGLIQGRGQMFTAKNIQKTMQRLGLALQKPDLSDVKIDDGNYINKNIRFSNRPFLLRMVRVKNCVIKHVSLRQPAAWTLHFYQCRGFEVDGIKIFSHANQNNDGIDIDSSSDGVIRHCDIDAGDDAICFKTTSPVPTTNIQVEHCRLSSHWGAIKFGTESMGDFKNIIVRNCKIHDTRGGGVKILSVDGAHISRVTIDGIQMDNVDMPIFVRLGERRLVYRDAPRQPVGSISDITISNVKATTRSLEQSRVQPPTGIFITGTPDYKISDVTLKNVQIKLPGGGAPAEVGSEVPENETHYPEFTMFGGPLPAYGLYARHVQQLKLENVTFQLLQEDRRKAQILKDVGVQ